MKLVGIYVYQDKEKYKSTRKWYSFVNMSIIKKSELIRVKGNFKVYLI